MAKDASAMVAYRKSKAKSKYSSSSSGNNESTSGKSQSGPKRQIKGAIVSAVEDNAEYEVYKMEAGKEVPLRNKDGSIVTRTGKRIREKMIYNRNINKWISNDKGRRYIIRRKN